MSLLRSYVTNGAPAFERIARAVAHHLFPDGVFPRSAGTWTSRRRLSLVRSLSGGGQQLVADRLQAAQTIWIVDENINFRQHQPCQEWLAQWWKSIMGCLVHLSGRSTARYRRCTTSTNMWRLVDGLTVNSSMTRPSAPPVAVRFAHDLSRCPAMHRGLIASLTLKHSMAIMSFLDQRGNARRGRLSRRGGNEYIIGRTNQHFLQLKQQQQQQRQQ